MNDRDLSLLALAGIALFAFLTGGAVMAVTLSAQRRGFLDSIIAEVRRQLGELRPDLDDARRRVVGEILAAQAALESGWGASRAWREGWNGWNVSKGSWSGPTIPGGDLEYRQGEAAPVKIRQEWRKYSSLGAAVSDLFALLGWSKYRAARDALMRGDANGYAAQLRAGGYFTAPLAEYQGGIATIRASMVA